MTLNLSKPWALAMCCLAALALVITAPNSASAEEQAASVTVQNPSNGCDYTITVYYSTSPPSVRSTQDVQCPEPDPNWVMEQVRELLKKFQFDMAPIGPFCFGMDTPCLELPEFVTE